MKGRKAEIHALNFEAYELDIDDDELRRAPSFRADKDGDRSQEAELHRY